MDKDPTTDRTVKIRINRMFMNSVLSRLASLRFGANLHRVHDLPATRRTFEHMIRSEQERQRIASVDALRARGIDPIQRPHFL